MGVDIWDELFSILKTVIATNSLERGPEPAIEEGGGDIRSAQFHTFLEDIGEITITIQVQRKLE